MRTLAVALARIHGRYAVTDHEMELIRRVVLSTAPEKWVDVLSAFRGHPEGRTKKQLADALGGRESAVKHWLRELVTVGLLDPSPMGPNNPTIYKPKPVFLDLLTGPVDPLDHVEDLESPLRE